MDDSRLGATAMGIGLVRLFAGIALGASPGSFLRFEPDIPRGSSMLLMLRTVGIRDLAIGLGTVHAARSGSIREVQRWVSAGLVSDALDVAAGIAASRTTGVRGVVSALIAAPVAVADLFALAMLADARRDDAPA